MSIRSFAGSHRRSVATVVVAGLAIAGFGLYWFAPWNLFVDRRVDEALPSVVSTDATDPGAGAPAGAAPGESTEGGASPVVLRTGSLSSLEHETAGAVRVVELADGSRFVRLEDLATSNGPDLRVILTDRPASGRLARVGRRRGRRSRSAQREPRELRTTRSRTDVDLSSFRTVVMWCRRFSVGFGVAALEAAA